MCVSLQTKLNVLRACDYKVSCAHQCSHQSKTHTLIFGTPARITTLATANTRTTCVRRTSHSDDDATTAISAF